MANARRNESPLFLVLEGIDGSGTTTQLELLVHRLEAIGRSAYGTREPSTGPVGQLLREILNGGHATADGRAVDGPAMALLFAADRRDHLSREIEPMLSSGVDVVSDRYLLSSLAYQPVEADEFWVRELARDIRKPDLTIFLDVPVELAAERRRSAGRPTERYDGDRLLEEVARNYRRLVSGDERAVTIDGSGTVHEVAARVGRAVDAMLVR